MVTEIFPIHSGSLQNRINAYISDVGIFILFKERRVTMKHNDTPLESILKNNIKIMGINNLSSIIIQKKNVFDINKQVKDLNKPKL